MNIRCTLKKNSDFHRLYSRGKSAVMPHMVVYCRRNRLGVNRFGYTVSTKLGHAVVRNRVRRRLREITRLNAPGLKQGYDVVIVARARCVKAEYKKMEQDYLAACERLGMTAEEK